MNMKLVSRSFKASLQGLFLVTLLSLSIFNVSAQNSVDSEDVVVEVAPADAGGNEELVAAGEAVFEANCTSCHAIGVEGPYPNLEGVTGRRSAEWLKSWISNPQKMIDSGDPDAKALYAKYGGNVGVMSAFDYFTDDEFASVIAYLEVAKPAVTKDPEGPVDPDQVSSSGPGADITPILTVILVVLVLIVIALLLMFSLLRKTLNDKQERGELSEEDKEFVGQSHNLLTVIKHPAFIGLVAVILLGNGAWYGLQEGLFGIGVQTGYHPTQPIPFNHRLHAGDAENGGHEIDCNYCHTGVRKAKHANIPSGNICMNCHVKVKTDSEILKSTLYKAMDYDPEANSYGPNQTPIKWVRVHNLPDHVYFNHSQHVKVGGIECETCHGEIKEMESTVYQYSTLTMGWCIDCHRNTTLNTEGNAYYDELVKRHGEAGEGDFTVEKNGGTDCARCHY